MLEPIAPERLPFAIGQRETVGRFLKRAALHQHWLPGVAHDPAQLRTPVPRNGLVAVVGLGELGVGIVIARVELGGEFDSVAIGLSFLGIDGPPVLECGMSERSDGGTLQVLASMPARWVSVGGTARDELDRVDVHPRQRRIVDPGPRGLARERPDDPGLAI